MIYMEEELIAQVRAKPILYDLKHRGYRNQGLRKEAWDNIGEHLGRSGEYCKETWNKLRNAYTNALNRRKSRQQSSRKMPKWTFEDQMAFLPLAAASRPRNYETHSVGIFQDETQHQGQHNDNNSIDIDDDDVEAIVSKEEDDIKPSLLQTANNDAADAHSTTDQSDFAAHHFETSNYEEFLTPRREPKARNKRLESTMNELVTIMKNHNQMLSQHFTQNNCTDHDEDEMFFLSMAKFVKKLNPAERIRVKGEVSQIVFQAEFRSLPNDERNHQQNQEQQQKHRQQQMQQIPSTSQLVTSEQILSETGVLQPKIEKE